MNILEAQSYKKKGVELRSIIEFNKDDERWYLEIVEEIEDAVSDILDKRGHTLLSGWSKWLTEIDLK